MEQGVILLQNKELAELIKAIAVRAVQAQNPVQVQAGIVQTVEPPTFNIDGLELDDYFVKNIDGFNLEEGEQFYFIRQQGAKCYIAIPKQSWIQEKFMEINQRIKKIEQRIEGGDNS